MSETSPPNTSTPYGPEQLDQHLQTVMDAAQLPPPETPNPYQETPGPDGRYRTPGGAPIIMPYSQFHEQNRAAEERALQDQQLAAAIAEHGATETPATRPDLLKIVQDAMAGPIDPNHQPARRITPYNSGSARKIGVEMHELTGEAGPKELSSQEALGLLSYSDVLEGKEREDALKQVQASPNGQEYIQTLQEMAAELGAAKVKELAEVLRQQCLDSLASLGIPASKYSESLSWAFWDLAKQRHAAQHPEEVPEEYKRQLADPLAGSTEGSVKRMEIVKRQIGWEISSQVDSARLDIDSLQVSHPHYANTLSDLANGERNETGQLRSFVLAELGHQAMRLVVQGQGDLVLAA